MRYLDKYPNCVGCPVEKYCGTMISSIKLCNSYEEDTVSFCVIDRTGTPVRSGFESWKDAYTFIISRNRYDWDIVER